MSTTAEATTALEGWLQGGTDQLPGAALPWLQAERGRALERVRMHGLPSSKQEGWRYTGVKSLSEKRFLRHGEPVASVGRGDLKKVLITGLDAHRVVLVNGRFRPELSDLGDLPAGARALSLRQTLASNPDAVAGQLNKIAGDGAHVFASVNMAGVDDGLVLLLDRSVVVQRPIEILHLSVGMDEPRVSQPRHLVVLGEGARASIIERYLSIGDLPYCTNSVLELSLGRDSDLDHGRVQLESANAFHLTGLYLAQEAGSRYRGVNVGLGASWARTDLVVRFLNPHAGCDLKGLYLAGDRQLMDYHLNVEHGVPQCASRESFKGILYGKGRAVFDGRVFVARHAQKTDAHLSNSNLLLSRNAEVDTKPQLEILADDVKCSHGTTVGQIEPEMLFYLRSRGISAVLARRMLCLGFAGEIIDSLGPEALREHVAEHVGQRLEKAPF